MAGKYTENAEQGEKSWTKIKKKQKISHARLRNSISLRDLMNKPINCYITII